ncbi:hypothetical protein MNBD_GAMMA03-650 [hydrothermal vent metagenome]|uniref:PilZ domain-containing protein n=1 Tax=hydrothermal vent metagenome TaxID=652676 RepID=A0A3B0VP78_9ZZZZ
MSALKTNTLHERRQFLRVPTNLESVLESKKNSIYTTVINLSEQGVGFLSAKPFKKGDTVNINFDYYNNVANPIKLKVDVRSCRKVDLEYYIGGSIANKSIKFQRFFKSITPSINIS